MPRSKGSSPRAVSSGPNWYGFITCEFDANSKAAFESWNEATAFDHVWEWFYEQVDAFKVTFAWNEKIQCYQVSMTGTAESEKMYFGWTLTAKGRDIERTLRALMFKHTQILKEKWVKNVEGTPKDDDWVG